MFLFNGGHQESCRIYTAKRINKPTTVSCNYRYYGETLEEFNRLRPNVGTSSFITTLEEAKANKVDYAFNIYLKTDLKDISKFIRIVCDLIFKRIHGKQFTPCELRVEGSHFYVSCELGKEKSILLTHFLLGVLRTPLWLWFSKDFEEFIDSIADKGIDTALRTSKGAADLFLKLYPEIIEISKKAGGVGRYPLHEENQVRVIKLLKTGVRNVRPIIHRSIYDDYFERCSDRELFIK